MPSLYVLPLVRWRSGGGLPLFGCQVELQLCVSFSFFLLGLLSLSPVPTRLDSTWWLVLGRTKGYLGDMRGSETSEKMRGSVGEMFQYLFFIYK